MITALKPLLRRALVQVPPLERVVWRSRAYSQEGEDLILARYFGYQAKGFYVDVGAHHPLRFSNTQIFYDRGWRGVNIDAMPGSMAAFRKHRARDVNIEVGVDEKPGRLQFHVFNEPALNTFDPAVAKQHEGGPYTLREIVEVEVLPLNQILARHVPAGQAIDFLSVDVEGRDVAVLQSNDWATYRPRVIIAEALNSRLATIAQDPVAAFLSGVGYEPFAKTVNSILFEQRS